MSFYPEKISARFYHPRNAGKLEEANAEATNATFVCGMFLQLRLHINEKTKEISAGKFQTNGCGYLIAAADILVETIAGKHLNQIHALDANALCLEIEYNLGAFPESRQHCLKLALETLQKAFADFRARQVEEFTGEKALICTCFGVSEETVEKVIAQNALYTVEEVTEICNAGGGCGSCQPLIQDLLDVYQNEN